VGQRLGFFLPGDLHHPLRDQRPRDRGPQKVLPFVDRPCPHHRKNKIPGELLLQVVNVDLARAGPLGLGI